MPHVSELSREEKLKLITLLEEKKRRKRMLKKQFQPHPGQLEVIKSTKFIRFVACGNGWGKTATLVNEVVWACIGHNPILNTSSPVPIKSIIVLDKPEKIEDSYIPEFNKWFDTSEWEFLKQGKPFISKIRLPNGSEIRFGFHGQEELSFEGVEYSWIGFDEPFPRHIFVGLQRGARTKNRPPRFLICGTPIGQPWMKEELWDPAVEGKRDDIECFTGSSEQNISNLEEGALDRFARNLTKREKDIRLHGMWFNLEGYALAHLFKPEVHIIPAGEIPDIVSAVVSIDPHPAKAHVAALLGCDRDGYLYYLKEIERKALPRDFARELRAWYQGFPVMDIVCDSLGSGQFTGGEGFKSFVQILQEEGVRVRPTTWQEKEDKAWIERIREILSIPTEPNNFGQKTPKLRIAEGCDKIIREIKTVTFKKKRHAENYEDKLAIEDKDYLACLKYALASNLTPKSKKAKAYKRVEMPYVPKPHQKRQTTKLTFNWRKV